ncbi:MAG: glycosyltransferase [Elusimicrobia bacterium]|nr:glycosyltransferase [Elusimicrobiota bacterium]
MKNQFISIIIPTYNRRELLVSCIDSINRQNYSKEDFELIIVDDGSTVNINEFIKEYTEKMPFSTSIININRSGPAFARNTGVEKARGTIIAFTEDDIILDPNWLKTGSGCFINDEISAVEGITKYIDSNKPVRRLEKHYQLAFLPCNLMFRKSIFNELGGYDISFYDENMNIYFREDIELGFRLLESGYKAVVSPEMLAYHPRQYQTIKGAYDHAKRYYFDPFLCKKHNKLFRKMIEVKKIGIFTIKRPLHYLSLFSVLSFILAISFNARFMLLLLLLNVGICFKYKINNLPGYFEILPLPLYYVWHFLKGCFEFKSFRAVL